MSFNIKKLAPGTGVILNCKSCPFGVAGSPCLDVAGAILSVVPELGVDRYELSDSDAASLALASLQPTVSQKALTAGSSACEQLLSARQETA